MLESSLPEQPQSEDPLHKLSLTPFFDFILTSLLTPGGRLSFADILS